MGSNVTEAATHLLRHLEGRLTKGEARTYLTEDARLALRNLFQTVREVRKHGRPQARAQPVPIPETPVPPREVESREAPVTSELPAPSPPLSRETATGEPSRVETAPDYPVLPVARGRITVAPRGDSKAAQLASLQELLANDPAARPAGLREKMVFAVGDPDAELMIVGEAPGFEEEKKAEPFVGPAGQLLTKIVLAMGLQRESVYISNIVKFRPEMPEGDQGTKNRRPTPEELQACLPYLLAEIDIVKPKIIVAAGVSAAEGLTGKNVPVGRLRGKVHAWNGIPLVVTYHPSYLLHNKALSERRKVWEDMLLVMEVLRMRISDKQRAFFTRAG